jgi:hypothetical protein
MDNFKMRIICSRIHALIISKFNKGETILLIIQKILNDSS